MIRFLFRFAGLWVLAAAFIFLIYDGTKSIADRSSFFVTRGKDVWAAIHQTSLIDLQPMLERRLGAWAWDPAAVTLLNQPAWLVLGVLGVLLVLLGRRKKPVIGYGRD
ncbi:MAG: hypothetical protein H3C55_05960 [Pseudorhodoplanes sp.]|nr:hypothetical protein [Pseudorhodoplanes sp.]MBW7948879.1 hypothetical protein [Pseudorhodoplanes sp.]MCQ3943637.1 hypothetical protein [Alphaproteobacteria bacterium]